MNYQGHNSDTLFQNFQISIDVGNLGTGHFPDAVPDSVSDEDTFIQQFSSEGAHSQRLGMDLGGHEFNHKHYRGDEQDKKEAALFKDKYEQHKTDYLENGPKFGGPQVPFMIANEEDIDFSHGLHVGSKRSNG